MVKDGVLSFISRFQSQNRRKEVKKKEEDERREEEAF